VVSVKLNKIFSRCEESPEIKMELPLLSPAAENSSAEEPELDINSMDIEEDLCDGTETQPSR
jgi:hypothetical protein